LLRFFFAPSRHEHHNLQQGAQSSSRVPVFGSLVWD
jgi:hypothetical protein